MTDAATPAAPAPFVGPLDDKDRIFTNSTASTTGAWTAR
jgi:hypothetical protein